MSDNTSLPERLYLDFDSFFASAEQHFNPALRDKPIGVVVLDSAHTGCIAVSREAKALGVKTNMPAREARVLVPNMIFVVARPDVYVRLHKRILAVIETVVPIQHVRSIDEVVCALLPSEGRQRQALAAQIKAALLQEFSPVLTCSIGMAPTELLAKIAAERQKPDGTLVLDVAMLPAALADLKLEKLPGVGDGMRTRLAAVGVTDFSALWALAPKQARAIWGNVEGERFLQELHGMHAPRSATRKRMFGHSRVLPREWRSPEKVEDCARQLLAGAARRLRRTNLRASKLSLSLRSQRLRSTRAKSVQAQRWHWERQFAPSRDDRSFGRTLAQGLAEARAHIKFSPHAVSVILHGLDSEADLTGDMFDMLSDNADDRARWEKVSDMMDQMRARFGGKALSLGVHDAVPGGYVGGKIAFGRIPEAEDFEGAIGEDNDTHFCTF
ncbi:type VI secretion protein ImpB [Yoonia sp. GPGPB17]|uniref:Y-family DNA polymerase n=1 Tax=Yoonia sp. GPGPB17 TaxID=3026147 RepID=UPI0030C0F752